MKNTLITSPTKFISTCISKLYFVVLAGGALLISINTFLSCFPIHLFGQDICSSITCANLSVEIIRQEDNVSAGCPPMGASCGNSFRQLTYKVYLRAKKTIPPGQQPLPFKLEYSELAVAVKLKSNQTPQLSYIDVAATQSCYQMGAGADWYNFPSQDGDKVIFEPTENRVAISFGNLTGSATCGYEAPNGSSNQITMNFTPAPNWAEPCGGGGLQCAYAELFTVVVNAFPGEAVGFEFDTQMLMYDPSTAPGGVCNPISQVITGQRNGLVNLVVGLPATFTGTANENVIAGFSNTNQQINYTDQPLKLTNFGNAPMTVSYVEFKVSALMQNAGLEYIGVTPRVYDGVGGSKTLHYMIPLNVTIPSGQSVDICTIRVVASQGNLNNMPWSAEFSYLETATKSRISTAGVCTRLNATALPASVNHPGDPACTDPSVHFTVDAVAATCTEFWVRVGLRTTTTGANISLSRMSFELAFDWTDAGIQFTGVNYSDWPVMNCGATGCFTGPPQSCYSYNPNGKIFKFCYATDDNSAPTYSLDPSSYMDLVFSIPNGACIENVQARALSITYTGTDYQACIPVRDAVAGFPVCATGLELISGTIETETGADVSNVTVTLSAATGSGCHVTCNGTCQNQTDLSNSTGAYGFCAACPNCDKSTLTPVRDDSPLNGLTTYDLVLISKHILGIEALGSPYKMIAADANIQNNITTADIVELRKLILGIYSQLPHGKSWRFVNKTYVFPNSQNPFMPLFPQIIDCFTPDPNTDYDFIGIKIGDVNNSVVANRPNNRPIAELSWPHTRAAVGGTITIPVVYTGAGQLDAIQMGLRFDPSRLQLIGPSQGDIESYNLACFNLAEAAQGKIRTLWLPMVDWFEKIQPGAILFYLHFKVLAPSTADSPLRLDPDLLDGAAWTPDGTEYALLAANNPLERSLEQTRPVGSLIASMRPNPSQGATVLEVLSEKAETARIALHDASGKRLFMKEWTLIQGAQEIPLPETENLTTGVYVWKVITRSDMVQGHLVKN